MPVRVLRLQDLLRAADSPVSPDLIVSMLFSHEAATTHTHRKPKNLTDDHPALEQQLFNVAQTRLRPEIPANGPTDDGRRKTVTVTKRCKIFHRANLRGRPRNVTMPCLTAVTGTFYVPYNDARSPSIMRSTQERPAGGTEGTSPTSAWSSPASCRVFHLAFSFHLRCRPDEIDRPCLARPAPSFYPQPPPFRHPDPCIKPGSRSGDAFV